MQELDVGSLLAPIIALGGSRGFRNVLRWLFKFLVIGGVVIVAAALLGLFVMSSMARMHGVKSISIPSDYYISGHLRNADYADAYRVKMEFTPYRSIDDVIENAWEKGSGAIYRTDKEVCYEGVAPGLTYRVSYILDLEADPPTLTVCTTVHYVETKGQWYFAAVMPVHKMLMPFMVDRMSKASVGAHP
jgi:hypothetical protein